MIGRGDMGVEMPFEDLPAIQKKLTQKVPGLESGDRIIITGGVTNGKSDNTDLIKVEKI